MTEKALDQKRSSEKKLVSQMIHLYCKKQHGTSSGLCPECQALSDYALQRIEHCPVMAKKSFCSHCSIHCYRPEMREKIRAVMRFSGPRMLLYHPICAVRHALSSLR